MNNELVSIIMPVYKTEEFLLRAIQSVQAQTYQEIEIIIIDDDSPDHSSNIYEQAAREDKRIQIIRHNKNQGQGAARNTGLDNARGKWVLFLDSDDIIYSDSIEKMIKAVQQYNVDILMASFNRNINGIVTTEYKERLQTGKYGTNELLEKVFDIVPINVLACIGTKLYNLQFLNKYKIRFKKQNKYNEDLAFMLDAISNTTSIGYIDLPIYEYIIRESGSTQSSYRPELYKYLYNTRIRIEQLMKQNGLYEKKKNAINQMWLDIMILSLVEEFNYKRTIDQAWSQIINTSDVLDSQKQFKPAGVKNILFHWTICSKKKTFVLLAVKFRKLFCQIKKLR